VGAPDLVDQVIAGGSLDQATRLLAEARTVDELKLIRDQAEAMRMYARERDLGLEAQNHAAEIKIRAERRLGEILHDMPKNEGTRTIGRNSVIPPNDTPRLADLGISRVESSRWQPDGRSSGASLDQSYADSRASTRASRSSHSAWLGAPGVPAGP
jgi:hypothetical protein